MRIDTPERGADEEAINAPNMGVIEDAIDDVFPAEYGTLSDRNEDRLFETICQYVAHREELKPRGQESRQRARISAKKQVADCRALHQQSIDNILQALYSSEHRTPNECFETHLKLTYLEYYRVEHDLITDVQEQLLRLQNALLELADLDTPPLEPDEIDVSEFQHESTHASLPDIEELPDDLPKHVDQQLPQIDYQKLLDAGKDAMAESRLPFHIQDVTATDTAFGQTWRKVKEIASEYLSIYNDIDQVDHVYVSNDLDNVRFQAYAPDTRPKEPIVQLRLQYYPTGLLTVESTSFAVIGGEQTTKQWYVPPHEWGQGYPLERHHIRGYIDDLLAFTALSKEHFTRFSGHDQTTPWIARQ